MMCPHCSTVIPSESRFCLACGAALETLPKPTRPESLTATRPSPMLFNLFGRLYLQRLRSMLGEPRFRQVCEQAAVPEWIHQLPSNNLMRQVPFTHIAALHRATSDLLGPTQAHAFHITCGHGILQDLIPEFGPLARPYRALLRCLPVLVRTTLILQFVATSFDRFSDQASSCARQGQRIVYTATQCAECWQQEPGMQGCGLLEGLLAATAQWIAPEHTWRVTEITCHGRGDRTCTFWIERV